VVSEMPKMQVAGAFNSTKWSGAGIDPGSLEQQSHVLPLDQQPKQKL
jgi:hypothetical protein